MSTNKVNLETDFVKQEQPLVNEFLNFVNASPSAFHAVDKAASLLKTAGFQQLQEHSEEDWKKVKPLGRYYITRNQSTIVAFVVGGQWKPGQGFTIAAAHTDSPCLKVKPISNKGKVGYLQVGVEIYGGGLWHTWFDRDLSLAGRVIVADDKESKFVTRLVRINRPIMRIPNLAIHLNREVNDKGFLINRETHLLPILATAIKERLTKESNDRPEKKGDEDFRHQPLLIRLLAEQLNVPESSIRDFELSLYDTQPATTGGALNEFIFSARLDNLMMSFCTTRALLNSLQDENAVAQEHNIRMVALFDNEEVGSDSDRGAGSVLMLSLLKRLSTDSLLESAISRSFLISADMAHAVHPNYAELHEENHRPAMHKGLVIKHNANQRYATTSVTAFVIRHLAKKYGIPVQDFCVRNDSSCGSTIGPILATNCGMRTVDVGAPQLSMHSIREMCGTADVAYSVKLLQSFYSEFSTLDGKITVDAQSSNL